MGSSRCWFYIHRDEAYGHDWHFEKPIGERRFRAFLRRKLGVDRLTHIDVWPSDAPARGGVVKKEYV